MRAQIMQGLLRLLLNVGAQLQVPGTQRRLGGFDSGRNSE
jgi:hypothetical protein